MAKITSNRNRECTEVVYRLGREDRLNEMELDIISKREIPYLLPGSFVSGIAGKRIVVRVENGVTLRRYLERGVRFFDFLRCVRQVLQAVQECECHGVRSQNLYFDLDNCFVDEEKAEIQLCFWPVLTLETYSDAERFLQEMAAAYSPCAADSELFAQYMSLFAGREKFDTLRFTEQLGALFDRSECRSAAVTASARTANGGTIRPDLRPVRGGMSDRKCPTLFRTKTDTAYPLPALPVTLGRAPEGCGCVISDNPYIGRRHITFFELQGNYYARDEGARNESVIDGQPLPREQEAPLHDGSVLILGGEEYLFFCG